MCVLGFCFLVFFFLVFGLFYLKLWYYTMEDTILKATSTRLSFSPPRLLSRSLQPQAAPPTPTLFEMLMKLFRAAPSHRFNSAVSLQDLLKASCLPVASPITNSFPSTEGNVYFRSACFCWMKPGLFLLWGPGNVY